MNNKLPLRARWHFFRQKANKWIKTPIGIIATLVAIITAITTLTDAGEWLLRKLTPAQQLVEQDFMESQYIRGVNIPMEVLQKYPVMRIRAGGNDFTFNWASLKEGAQFDLDQFVLTEGCTLFNLQFKLQGQKLFAKTEFTDLKNQYIGALSFDKFHTRKQFISKPPYQDDVTLEVLDISNYVIFRMEYKDSNIVDMKGYFIKGDCIHISTPEGFLLYDINNPKQMERALRYIRATPPKHGFNSSE